MRLDSCPFITADKIYLCSFLLVIKNKLENEAHAYNWFLYLIFIKQVSDTFSVLSLWLQFSFIIRKDYYEEQDILYSLNKYVQWLNKHLLTTKEEKMNISNPQKELH